MRDKNFDSIKNFNVPENWVENALNIPQTEKKSPVAFIKFSRTLSAVASLVLVCALSVAVFFYTQKDDIVVPDYSVKESETAVESSQSQTNYESTQNSSIVENPTDKNNLILPNGIIRPSLSPQLPTNGEANQNRPVRPTSPSQSETYPNVEPSESPTKPVKPEPTQPGTVKPTIPDTEPPTVKPTEPAPTSPVRPTQPPPPVEPLPTDPVPTGPAPSEPVVLPTEPAPSEPIGPTEPCEQNECRAYILKENIVGSGNIYCKVFLKNGGTAENTEKYPAYKVREYTDDVLFVFFPDEYNLIKKTGYYYCYFYNENGKLVGVEEVYFYAR